MVVDFSEVKEAEHLIGKLEEEIGSYPMFKKPICGFGSGGGGPIYNVDELKQWLDSEMGQHVVSIITIQFIFPLDLSR
jgi:carbamoylphosphate synthase large subunit